MKARAKIILAGMTVLFFQMLLFGEGISKKNILTFADSLYKNQDYKRASYEYLRVLHLFENSRPEKLNLHLKIGNSFARLGKLSEAKTYYDYCLEARDRPLIFNQALIKYGFLLFKKDRYRESALFLKNNQLSTVDEKVNTLVLANYFCFGGKKEAGDQFDAYKNGGKNYLKTLDHFFDARLKLKYKSPLLAGILSAIVPGSGRLYTGRVKEGLISLVSLLGTSYLAYEGFRDHGIKSFKGWLFSSVSAFLYIGNIHGAVVSAKLTNQMVENKYKKGIELTLKIYLND